MRNSGIKAEPIAVQRYLSGLDYPCSKKDLIDRAIRKGADKKIVKIFEKLEERKYDSPTEVTEEIAQKKKSSEKGRE